MYGEALLTWNPNNEADLAGYNIYIGNTPSILNFHVDVGLTATPNAPRFNVTNFENAATQAGLAQTYGVLYFAVTAYNTGHQGESGFSPVVSKAIAPKIMPKVWP